MDRIEELVAVEFAADLNSKQLQPGEKYSYFRDPKTGKYYRPAEGFTIQGTDLSDRFIEVPTE